MAVDVLVAVADEALRMVLEVALTADGCTVQTAGSEAEALAGLVDTPPRVLLLDAMLPASSDSLAWAAHHAPAIPLILLVSAVDAWPTPSRSDAVLLEMPFGREELRRAVAMADRAGHIKEWRRVGSPREWSGADEP